MNLLKTYEKLGKIFLKRLSTQANFDKLIKILKNWNEVWNNTYSSISGYVSKCWLCVRKRINQSSNAFGKVLDIWVVISHFMILRKKNVLFVGEVSEITIPWTIVAQSFIYNKIFRNMWNWWQISSKFKIQELWNRGKHIRYIYVNLLCNLSKHRFLLL